MAIICAVLRVIYGFAKSTIPVFAANGILLIFMIILLVLKLIYDKR
jgi:uncharacterized protein with PQ loop repeat